VAEKHSIVDIGEKPEGSSPLAIKGNFPEVVRIPKTRLVEIG
jgi:hypothetical protein